MTVVSVALHSPDWRVDTLAALRRDGCAIVTDALEPDLLADVRTAIYRARDCVEREIGRDRLTRAGEIGTVRLPMRYDDAFFRLLEHAPMLDIVDATVGATAILHLQNAFVLPSFDDAATPEVFQNSFHRDFPRYLNGYEASINAFFAIDAFTEENGATLVVPGSHQLAEIPSIDAMRASAVPALAPAGSMMLFDSTLWHAAGRNRSGSDRLAVNHQFTRSFVKQQIDYVRALGDADIERQPPRTQQLLGWYTRVVTSLDEYYKPESERLYRKGQG